MVTSPMSRSQHPSRLTILISTPAGQQSGLIADSVVMTDNLATIKLAAVARVIGSIEIENLYKNLRNTFGL